MALTNELRAKQAQTQVLAPQLRQSLHLLSLSLPELRTELYREMSSNPVIEDIGSPLEHETISHKEAESEQREMSFASDYTEDDDIPDTTYTADADALERRQKFFDSQTKEETLEEHLKNQLRLSDIAPEDIPLAEVLIGELDDNGLFSGSLPDIEMVTGESEGKIRHVLHEITELDPAGCGALSLKECLLAQLDKLEGTPNCAVVKALIEHHLGDIAAGRADLVRKELNLSPAQYASALAALRTLDPRPGRAYTRAGRDIAYINPEIHAVNVGGKWVARVDERSLPEIHISSKYQALLADPKTDKETKDYIRARIAAAQAIIDAVARRQQTITAIAQAIFDAQPGFFTEGFKGLRPLNMQEIAAKVGVHHTTVSRTVRDKYVSTPRGTVELRRFFTQGLVRSDGETIVKDAVMERLAALIADEDRTSPLSDERLAALLKAEGYPVARRTVAKYRLRLHIPGTAERKASAAKPL